MELQTVEVPRAQAREAAAEYTRAARRLTGARATEFAEIARAYRLAAREGVALIALTPTLQAGGTVTRTRILSNGTAGGRRLHYLLPRLAVGRASAAFVYTEGVQRNGSLELVDSLNRSWNYRIGRVQLAAGTFELPAGYAPGRSLLGRRWTPGAWSSMVPIVPPKHRPRSGSPLNAYHVLWEVDNWTWSEVPPPPSDPALLRHIGGDLYAVLATWDLTELERLVLSGRTRDVEL